VVADMNAATLGRAQILLGALLFSTGGVAIKLSALDGWQVAGLRCGIAAVAMWLILPAARRGWSWRTGVVAIPYAATLILFTLANKETTAANAIFLQDTAPLYLLLIGPWLLREAIRRIDLAYLAALAVGIVLIFSAVAEPLATAPRPTLGNTIALAAGVSWAFTIAGLRWLAVRTPVSDEEPAAAVVAGATLAFLVSLGPALPLGAVQAGDWLIVLYLGVFQIALAYVLITRGIGQVSALEASLLLLIEPVFVPLWAWLILGETVVPLALAGGAVIVAATGANLLLRRRASADAS
jgi:drug/metabolite transporter, DME family